MKNHRFLIFTLLLTAVFSLSSCLHIIEEITIKKDGSGSYQFKIDGSEIKKMVGALDEKSKETPTPEYDQEVSVQAADTSAKDDKEIDRAVKHLKTQPGITHTTILKDSVNYINGYTFDFDNVDNLGKAILGGPAEATMGLWNDETRLKLEKKAFKRVYGSNTFRDMFMELLKNKKAEEGESTAGMEGIMRMMFGSLSFKQVYYFPDQKVKGCNDPRGKISADKHTVTIYDKPFSEEDSKRKKVPDELKIRLK